MSKISFGEYYNEEYWDEKKQEWTTFDKPEITHYACAGCGVIKSIKESPPHKAVIAFTAKDTQKEFAYYTKWKMLCDECFFDKDREEKRRKDDRKVK